MKTVLPLAFALALAPVQLVRAEAPPSGGKTACVCLKPRRDRAGPGDLATEAPAP